MTTNELLKKMETAAFGDFFFKEIADIFDRDCDQGKYGGERKEYNAAMRTLQKLLPEDKLTLLSEYEKLCQQIRNYSARYGFVAGVFCGFKQILTMDNAYDGGFERYVVEDVAWKPNMLRHTDNFANIERRNEVHGQICADMPKKAQKTMVPVECYWSQVAHSASLNAFYCGYRAAGAIIDAVALTEINYMSRVSKQVTMEHALGYIESFSEKERRQERERTAEAKKSATEVQASN